MERLKVLREQKGLSREILAADADMSPVTIWRYETGKRSPNVETLEKLARALDAEVADFFPKAEPSLFETGEQRRDTALWSSFINERAGDLEEWGYSFHKGADPADLPDREFLAFVGGLSVAAEEYRRVGQIVDAFYQEVGESLSEELSRAWRRLSRAMQAMVTAGVEQRVEQLEPGVLPDNVIHLQDRKTA